MGDKRTHYSFNRNGETIKIEVRDSTYKVMFRGTYKLNSVKDMYNMFSMLEKFTPYTIHQIINHKNDFF